jgi:hypothetical protein
MIFSESRLEFRSLIAGVGEQLLQERIHPEQGREQQDAAVAILDIGGKWSNRPIVSTRMWRFLPLISAQSLRCRFLPAS